MFREDFVWGVSSSAYQIEGRLPEDGAGTCIWDTFREQGNVFENHNTDDGTKHLEHYREDFALMKELGIRSYRFSISWARLMPDGKHVNDKAVTLYRDMILEMKKNGIEPFLTMYHWELPQALQDEGGWLNDEIVTYFAQYAKVVAEHFTDLCDKIFTLNEPQCFLGLANTGANGHAPGVALPHKDVFHLIHNALKAHGAAVIALRKYAKGKILVGYAPTSSLFIPASDKPEDIEAARKSYMGFPKDMARWSWNVSWYSDPVFLGHYPEEGMKRFAKYLPEITKEDMELISQPLDFMGQNIYNGVFVKAGENGEVIQLPDKLGAPKTQANWPVTPECMYWGVKFLYERYHMPIYITENGMACHDLVDADGGVHDGSRITFLDQYLSQLQRAADEGIDVRGYFEWTFLDNYEWAQGFSKRYGLVYVDYETGRRIPKDSAYWYREVCQSNGRNLSINQK